LRTNFSALFRKSMDAERVALEPNDAFPLEERLGAAHHYHGMTVVCFVSLTCSECIDLLGNLNGIASRLEHPLVLATIGRPQEIESLRQHFKFPFPIANLPDTIAYGHYRIEGTPYAYVLENARVRSKGFIHHEQELSALVEAAKERRVPDGH